ncbi:hypothetical protein ACJX0J_020632, partial [Zea mays]
WEQGLLDQKVSCAGEDKEIRTMYGSISTKTEDKEHRLQCPKVRIGRKKLAAVYSYFSGLLLLQLMHNFLFIYYHHIFNVKAREREREEQFRLDETANEEHAKRVFHNAARKVINGSMSDARVKAVTVKPGLHRFGADGFIEKSQRMGHRGPDPDHPETRYAEEVGDRQQQQQVIILMHLGWIYFLVIFVDRGGFFLDRNKNMEILINRNCFSTTDLQFENLETKEKLYVVRAVLLWLNYEFSDLE